MSGGRLTKPTLSTKGLIARVKWDTSDDRRRAEAREREGRIGRGEEGDEERGEDAILCPLSPSAVVGQVMGEEEGEEKKATGLLAVGQIKQRLD